MITVPNDSYHAGRAAPIRLVVLHTAECPCTPGMAEGVARYLANPSVQASAHYVVDPTATVAQVAEADTAWAAPGANADGIQIEQAGRAAFTAAEWAAGAPRQMLEEQTVPLVADICRRNGLPALWLTAADLLAGKRGITDHATVNEAYHRSDHTDCGAGYPAAFVVERVAALLRGDTATTPAEDEDMTRAFITPDNSLVLVSGNSYRPAPGAWPDVHQGIVDLIAAGVVTEHAPGVAWKPITAAALALLQRTDTPAQPAPPAAADIATQIINQLRSSKP